MTILMQTEEGLTDKEKLEIIHNATSQTCLSAVLSGLLEVFYLRKLLRESKTETVHYKKLLDLVCDEETKKELEELDSSSWVDEPKGVQ